MTGAWHIFGLTLVLVLLIWLADRAVMRRRTVIFRKLARSMRLHYSPFDRFNLASRLLPLLPDPAAANVIVRDLMYHTTAGGHDYVFTVQYTLGTVSGERRRKLVVSLREPFGRSSERFEDVRFAETTCCVAEQYQSLLQPKTP